MLPLSAQLTAAFPSTTHARFGNNVERIVEQSYDFLRLETATFEPFGRGFGAIAPFGGCSRPRAIIVFVERFELEMGRDVTEAGAGSEDNNRCHKRDLLLTVPLYPG